MSHGAENTCLSRLLYVAEMMLAEDLAYRTNSSFPGRVPSLFPL